MDEEIDVWEIWPHLETDYDCAIFDDHTKAAEYAKEVALSFMEDAANGDELEMKVKHVVMTRHDYEEAGGL